MTCFFMPDPEKVILHKKSEKDWTTRPVLSILGCNWRTIMKFACTALLAMSLCAGLAQAQTNVPSKNAVGYVKIGLPEGGINLVSLNFRKVGGGDMSLLETFGTNQLKQSGFSSQSDKVSLWDESVPGYETYFQKPDGNFYNLTNSAVAVNPILVQGRSFWLLSGVSTVTGITNSIFLMGEVVGASESQQPIVEGLNLINFPYAAGFPLNGTNKNWIAEGATASNFSSQADKIFVWNGFGYNEYFLKSDGKWYLLSDPNTPIDPVVPVGTGAWYDSRIGSSLFTSTVTRVYSYPSD